MKGPQPTRPGERLTPERVAAIRDELAHATVPGQAARGYDAALLYLRGLELDLQIAAEREPSVPS